MSVKYVYEQIVLKGALKAMIVNPAAHNSLTDRAERAYRSLFAADIHAPRELKDKIEKIRSAVHANEVGSCDPRFLSDKTPAKIASLSNKQKQAMLAAYFELAVEVIQRHGAEQERRRLTNSGSKSGGWPIQA